MKDTMWLAAWMILLALALNMLLPTGLPVKQAELVWAGGEPARISLPYQRDMTQGQAEEYRFTFILPDTGRQVRFLTTGCVLSASVGGAKLPLKTLRQQTCPHDALYAPRDGSRRVDITLSPGQALDLSVERARPIAPPWPALLSLVAAGLMIGARLEGRRRRVAALGLTFILSFAMPPGEWFLFEWWQRYFAQPLALATCLGVALWAGPSRRWLERFGRWLARVRLPGALPPLLFFGAAAGLSQYLFEGLPHIADTHAQYIHARFMAAGEWVSDAPRLPEFFRIDKMIELNGAWFSNYLPGHVMLLALGHLAGLPWLVNPLLGALAVAATALLAREIGGRGAGAIAGVLALLSPLLLFMSAEYMNHATCLLFSTLFVWGALRLLKTGGRRYACIAGVCLGFVFITRAQNALAFGLPAGLYLLWHCRARPELRPAAWLAAAAFLPFAVFLGWYSAITFGNPWYLEFARPARYAGKLTERLGSTGWIREWTRMGWQLRGLHESLFGWPSSSLMFVFVLALRLPPYSALPALCCLGQVALLPFIPFGDTIFGPRYLYECSGCLIALTAVCLSHLPEWLGARWPQFSLPARQGAVAAFVAALAVLALHGHIRERFALYANNYWEGNPGYLRTLERNVQTPALIFMTREDEFRLTGYTQPPQEDAPVIYARDLGERNHLLIEAYPERRAYLADGERLTPLAIEQPDADSVHKRRRKR